MRLKCNQQEIIIFNFEKCQIGKNKNPGNVTRDLSILNNNLDRLSSSERKIEIINVGKVFYFQRHMISFYALNQK